MIKQRAMEVIFEIILFYFGMVVYAGVVMGQDPEIIPFGLMAGITLAFGISLFWSYLLFDAVDKWADRLSATSSGQDPAAADK